MDDTCPMACEYCRVDDCWICLQRHVAVQAVDEDAGGLCAFVIEVDFFFYKGCQCDGLRERCAEASAGLWLLKIQQRCLFAEATHHGVEHGAHGGVMAEAIGVRVEKAFKRLRVG